MKHKKTVSPSKKKKNKAVKKKKRIAEIKRVLSLEDEEYKQMVKMGSILARYTDLVQELDDHSEISKEDEDTYISTILSIFSIYGCRGENPMPKALHMLTKAIKQLPAQERHDQ